MEGADAWTCRAGFRRNAIKSLNQAVAENERIARADPALAG